MTWTSNIVTEYFKGMIPQEKSTCIIDFTHQLLWRFNGQTQVFGAIIICQFGSFLYRIRHYDTSRTRDFMSLLFSSSSGCQSTPSTNGQDGSSMASTASSSERPVTTSPSPTSLIP